MPLATALPFIHGVCPDSVQSIYCCGPVPCVLAANLWLIARLAGPWAVCSVCLLSGDMLLPLGTQLMSMDGGFRWVHQGVRDDLMAAAQAGDLRPRVTLTQKLGVATHPCSPVLGTGTPGSQGLMSRCTWAQKCIHTEEKKMDIYCLAFNYRELKAHYQFSFVSLARPAFHSTENESATVEFVTLKASISH